MKHRLHFFLTLVIMIMSGVQASYGGWLSVEIRDVSGAHNVSGSIGVGETIRLIGIYSSDWKWPEWTYTGDPEIVSSRKDGTELYVTGKSEGATTITFTASRLNTSTNIYESHTVTVNITVWAPDPTSISLPETQGIAKGATVTLTPTFTPVYASKKNLTWTTSDSSIAIVNSSGEVTGVNLGTTTITVTTKNNHSATCLVTVAPNIQFADATVKSLCIANWDTSGDGELNTAEATAVKDLGFVFRSNKEITSFNELQFFTGLEDIGGEFSDCSGLTSIIIPNSVTRTGVGAFSGCTSLTSVTMPNSVTEIGLCAFIGCSSLTSIIIPDSVTIIDTGAFQNCSSLTSATIPNNVTIIRNKAFFGCSSLTSVSIPNSVTSIKESVFEGCSNLTSVTIPNSVTSIKESAFSGCCGLTSITIPEGVTSIGEYAFSGCSGLTSVTIPNSVTSIGGAAFSGCSGLTSIEVKGGNSKYDSRDNCNAIITTASNTLITGCRNTVIPNSVTSIGWHAFQGCGGLTSVTIPNSVTTIGGYAFQGCSGLTSIIIPESVTSINSYTFEGCSGLTSVTIPNSVTTIGERAFRDCRGLTYVTIPGKSIGNSAFSRCTSLASVTIGNRVTSINYDAFSYCTSLSSVTIGNSVSSFGIYVFFECNNLTCVRVGKEKPVSIPESTFPNRSKAILIVPIGSKESYKTADYWKEFKKIVEYIEGDVNADEDVNVVDVVDIARFIVGTPANTFVELMADINKDNAVNLGDAVALVNNIAGDQNFVKAWNNPSQETANDVLNLTECYRGLSLTLDNERRYTAFQFDLFVPKDADVTQMTMNAERKQGHQLLYNKVEDGHYRVAAISTSNNEFNGNDGELLNIALNDVTSEEVSIRNIHFFDAEGRDYLFGDAEEAITTSLTPTLSKGEGDIYDLQGRKREQMQKGVNIVSGKKIIKE